MVDLAPGAVVAVVQPSPVVQYAAPGIVQGLWLKEGPAGPPGLDGHVIAVSDEVPGDLVEGALMYDTDDPGITGSEFVMRVVWNGSAYPSRPPVVYVEWVGPSAPPDAVAGDTWIET